MDTISHSSLLQRPTWNRTLVNKLLGEPDEVLTRTDGQISARRYSISRIEDAERSPEFKQRARDDAARKELIQERAYEIRESLKQAIAMDVKSLKVPDTGDIEEVFDACRAQMQNYDNMLQVADMETFYAVYSPHSHKGMIYPDMALLMEIGQHRIDLRFEAGRLYERHRLNAI